MSNTVSRPVVIDLGKVKRRAAKRLKKGQGPLVSDVSEAVEAAVAGLGEAAEGAVIVPVVVLFERKPKRRKLVFPISIPGLTR
jgi:hypothetical protein